MIFNHDETRFEKIAEFAFKISLGRAHHNTRISTFLRPLR